MYDETEAIETIVNARIDPLGPGVAVAVVKDGEVMHRKGYGLASLEWGCAIAPDTVFQIGSLTKPFTATAILLLEQEGKLRLSDPITAYLPDYPTHGQTITLTHLLTHTSGIPNYVTQPGFWERESRTDRPPAELTQLFRHLPLDFAPGARYSYSNSAYCLLGMVIETVTGQPYGDFVRERIFAPLGMAHSSYMHHAAIIPRRADGYDCTESGYARAPYMSMTLPYSSGSLGATLDDLIRWNTALREQTLLDAATQERMATPVRLNDGRTEGYGLGWGLSTYRNRRVVHHAGGVQGFSSFFGRFVDDGLTIIVLSNLGGYDAAGLAQPIANLALDLSTPVHQTVTLDEAARRRVAGRYAGLVETLAITYDGQHLLAAGDIQGELVPVSETAFALAEHPDTVILFEEPGENGYEWARAVVPFYWFNVRRLVDD